MTNPERQPLSAWQTEHVRFTVFSKPPAAPGGVAGVWSDVTGEEPEERTEQTKIRVLREQGGFRGGTLVTDSRPDRVDIVHAAAPDPTSNLPALGPVDAVLVPFRDLCVKWLESHVQGVHRVAFGVVALLPVDNRESGYAQLAPYLPFEVDTGARDFLYQINRRRPSSACPGAEINRLSKWSVAQWQTSGFGLVPGGVAYALGEPTFACRLELDTNSAPEKSDAITAQCLPGLLGELARFAQEIIEKGDVP